VRRNMRTKGDSAHDGMSNIVGRCRTSVLRAQAHGRAPGARWDLRPGEFYQIVREAEAETVRRMES